MSDKPITHGNRHLKALFRWLDYVSHKPVLWAKPSKAEATAALVEFSAQYKKAMRWQEMQARTLTPYERWRFKRRLFWKYGGAFCVYCGRSIPLEFLTLDHVQPRSKGGAVREVNNMVLACLGCNRDKGNKWELYTTEP